MGLIISRKEAIAAGLTRYFTGQPCVHGHIAERPVKTAKCVQCNRDKVRRWQEENPIKRIAQLKRNRAGINASIARTKARNPEKYKALQASWRTNNREQYNNSVANAKKKKPVKYKALRLKWEAKNADKVTAHRRNMGAKRRGASGKINKNAISLILKDQRHKCAYFSMCGNSFGKKDRYHVDHILAIAHGGTHESNNLQVLCPSCNLSKGAKDAMIFMRNNGFLL